MDESTEGMAEKLPRCEQLDGSTLRIVPRYTEAGRFCEANCVTITDGERTAIYVPLRALDACAPAARPEPGARGPRGEG